MKTLSIGNFIVKLVRKGEAYGLNDCLSHQDDDPLVEFYDTTQDPAKFGPNGQFVSRYYLGTLLYRPAYQGLCLVGGVPEWTLTGMEMAVVTGFLLAQEEAEDAIKRAMESIF